MRKLSDFRNLSFDSKIKSLVAVLIFMYPLFGSIFRHWFSGIALLIVLLGIIYVIFQLLKKDLKVTYDERWIILFIPMLFISYLASGMVNGWNENQLEFFGGELNFLLFIPLYLIITKVESSAELLIKGTIISGVMVFVQFFYQIILLDDVRVTGAYGHLFIGPISVLIAFVSISSYKYFYENKIWRLLIVFSTIGALITVAYSTSGTAYIATILLTLVIPFIIFKCVIKKIIFLIIFITCMVSSFYINAQVNYGVTRVVNNIGLYLWVEDKAKYKYHLGTVGTRVELWFAGIEIFKDNIFFGVGRNNFKMHAQKLKDDGLISSDTFKYTAHPHNIYIETLISKGLFGFIVLASIIFFLIKNYFYARKYDGRFNDTAIIHLVFILIVGLGTEAPLIKNNFVSVFLLYSAVFFSSNLRELSHIKTCKV